MRSVVPTSAPLASRNTPVLVESSLTLGDLFQILGRSDEARYNYEQAIDLIPSLGDEHKGLTGIVYGRMGTLLSFTGNYEQAKNEFDQAIKIYNAIVAGGKPIGLELPYATTFHQAAVMENFIGEYGKAGEYTEIAKTIHQKIGSTRSIDWAVVLGNAALTEYRLGKLTDAEFDAKRSLNVFTDTGQERHPAKLPIQLILADILFAKGRHDEYTQLIEGMQSPMPSASCDPENYWKYQTYRLELDVWKGDHSSMATRLGIVNPRLRKILLNARLRRAVS